jgi:ADP-heptose:LPS heptosyltransferase
MPRDPIDTVYQIGIVLSFAALFKTARITLLCSTAVSSFVKNLQNIDVIEYTEKDIVLFSYKLTHLARELTGCIDVCIVLEKDPALPLLYLAGQTAAPIRAGYETKDGFPFLNYRIKPSDDHTFVGDWNSAISILFGTRPAKRIRWSVSKETLDEVREILRDFSIPSGPPLIGIDLGYFAGKHGKSWCEALMKSAADSLQASFFIYSEHNPKPAALQWFQGFGRPIISELSVSRTAALISMISMMITGNTTLFAMTGLLEVAMIGIFEEKELAWNCPKAYNITGISYKDKPDLSTIDALIKTVKMRVKA